jgi:class 3 adenylate cyclase
MGVEPAIHEVRNRRASIRCVSGVLVRFVLLALALVVVTHAAPASAGDRAHEAGHAETSLIAAGVVAPSALAIADREGLALRGAWRVHREGTLEDGFSPAGIDDDFIEVPWAAAHRRTQRGFDVDDARWVVLSIRVPLAPHAPPFVIHFGELSEAYYAECRSEGGVVDRAHVGLDDPANPLVFASNWGRASVALAGAGSCAVVIPRASLGRVRALTAPVVVSARMSGFNLGKDGWLAIASIAIVSTACVLALLLSFLDRHDRVPRWAAMVTGAHAVRTALVTKGNFLPEEVLAIGGSWASFRVEYFLLAVTFFGAVRYIETIAGARIPASRFYGVPLLAFALLALVAPYEANRSALPLLQIVGIGGFTAALVVNYLHRRSSRSARWSLYGILVLVVGSAAEMIYITVVGRTSTALELLAGTEPLFQMAVLTLRSAENRVRAERLADATTHFVPKQFLQALGHDDVTTAKLGDGTAREMTMLFSDIRGFTTMSERMAPAEVFEFLNGCLVRIGPHVRAHRGFIDKYQGDAIMALFPESPADAVRAAVAMQREAAAWNARNPGRAPVVIGVGIHTGPVMMGMIGETERFEATVIGDAVNLSARLETLTKQLGAGLLVSEQVAATLPVELARDVRFLGPFAVKGKSQGIGVYEVFAADDDLLRGQKRAAGEGLAQALAFYRRGDLVEAITILGTLAEASPGDGAVRWWLGHVQEDLRQGPVSSRRDVVILSSK